MNKVILTCEQKKYLDENEWNVKYDKNGNIMEIS